MRLLKQWLPALGMALFVIAPGFATSIVADEINIPFEKFRLSNGLTVVVHEDHKAPVVAVAVWYHVGSKDEKPGKTGFAHLFEHLMFQGSEHYKDEFFRPFEQVGTTDQNGTTWLDRTNFFQTVPSTALDMALWMESDRMGHLLPAIDQATLDEQRGVVQNEKRQRQDKPYGKVMEALQAASFPEGHPYHWETIGLMEDLNAASLVDVKQWFKDYYGAANATLVLAGDIDLKTAKEKAEKYFGDIPAGPPVNHRKLWIAARNASTREVMLDQQVAQTRIHKSWNIPPSYTSDEIQLEMVAKLLGDGEASRLYERLVYRDQLADRVEAGVMDFELASLFLIETDVKKDIDPAKVEAAIHEELSRFLDKGPTAAELQRVKVEYRAHFVKNMERVGGFAGKAQILAAGQAYQNDPGAYQQILKQIDAATPASVLAAAKHWLAQGDYTLQVNPFSKFSTTVSTVDRTQGVPVVDKFPSLDFPQLQRGKLKNGIEVVLAERHGAPLVAVELQFDAGYAADQGHKLGTASFTMGMLSQGTKQRSALDIVRRREELGATINVGAELDTANATLETLKSQLKPSLELLAEIVRDPAFDAKEMQRFQTQWLSDIAQEKTDATSLATRLLPPLLFGEGHAYAVPLSGSGTEASITTLTAEDLVTFHRTWIRPDNVKILVAGDTKLDEILALLELTFGDWKAPAEALPKKNIATVDLPKQMRVFLVDQPGAQQSLIIAGQLAPSSFVPNHQEIKTMNGVLGGVFTSRLNMNLREDKHWAYGASSKITNALGQRLFMMKAPVQVDKTADSVREILKEAQAYIDSKPATSAEISKIKNTTIRSLPGNYETTKAVLDQISAITLYHRPDNYVQTVKTQIENQQDDNIRAAAKQVIQPQSFTWLVIGDLSKIEQPLRDLKLGVVTVLDADGKTVR